MLSKLWVKVSTSSSKLLRRTELLLTKRTRKSESMLRRSVTESDKLETSKSTLLRSSARDSSKLPRSKRITWTKSPLPGLLLMPSLLRSGAAMPSWLMLLSRKGGCTTQLPLPSGVPLAHLPSTSPDQQLSQPSRRLRSTSCEWYVSCETSI